VKAALCYLLFPAFAFAAPPEVVWSTSTGDRAEHGAVLLNGGLYVAGERKITELDPADGRIRRFLLPPEPTTITCRPVSTGMGLVAGDAAGRLLVWKEGEPGMVLSELRRDREIISLRTGDAALVYGGDAGGCVTALDRNAARAWSHCVAGSVEDGLAVVEGLVTAWDATGRLTARDAAKGGFRWAYATDAPPAGAPVAGGGALLLAGTDGHVYALDATRGTLRWRVHAGGAILGGPAAARGLVIVATESGGLLAVEVAGGRTAWRATLPAAGAAPAVLGDLVVLAASDNALHAFDVADGEPRWRVPLDGAVLAPPLLDDRGIIAVTEEGVAYMLR